MSNSNEYNIATDLVAKAIESGNKHLDFSYINGLEELPKNIIEIPILKSLNISGTPIDNIEVIEKFETLEILNVSRTRVTSIEPIRNNLNLIKLDLSDTDITSLRCLSRLSNLTHLDINNIGNKDQKFFFGWNSFEQFYGTNPRIIDLSPISNLFNLKELNIQLTSIIEILPLENLTNLEVLSLRETVISDLGALKKLSKLRKLDLKNSFVEDITAISWLHDLIELNLSFTRIKAITPLASLKKLRKIKLENTDIKSIKPLSETQSLEYLRINDTKVSDLSPLSKLTNLKHLEAEGNPINNLEPLKNLMKLEILDVGRSQVFDVQPLSGLKKLNSLSLRVSGVKDVSPLSNLMQLEHLDVRITEVSKLNPLRNLKRIRSLDLFQTKIQSIYELPNIWNLDWVVLKETEIKEIPKELYYYNDLNCIDDIRAWLKDLALGAHKNDMYKIQLCGNGTVGKSSIAERILYNKFTNNKKSTHGVQVYLSGKTIFKEYSSDPKQLLIWDFGGQEIYHQIHRLFFKDNSICILVFDFESYHSINQIDSVTHQIDLNRPLSYWLHDIYVNSPRTMVIIVQNKLDLIGTEVFIQHDVPTDIEYIGPIRVSAKDGTRINELKDAVYAVIENSDINKLDIPKSWWKIREVIIQSHISQKKRRKISMDLFTRLCRKHNVSINSETALLRYLDATGILLYDENLFPNDIILDQQWALDAIYEVLRRVDQDEYQIDDLQELRVYNFQQKCARENGQFLSSQLPFDKRIYSTEECNLFFQIMIKAGICFETNTKIGKNSDKIHVLFNLLPLEEPEVSREIWEARSNGKSRTVFCQKYTNKFHLHKGIFRSLIQRISDKVDLKHIWQDGLLLVWRNNTYARLTADYSQSHIKIQATGKYSKEALIAFRNVLNNLLLGELYFSSYVSNDDELFFSENAINNAIITKAKFALDINGVPREKWKNLTWCLDNNDKIGFSIFPQAVHDTYIKGLKSASELIYEAKDLLKSGNLINTIGVIDEFMNIEPKSEWIVLRSEILRYKKLMIQGLVIPGNDQDQLIFARLTNRMLLFLNELEKK